MAAASAGHRIDRQMQLAPHPALILAMKLYLPLALAKNLEARGIDGQMQRANARAARNLWHVKTGGAPCKGRIMRDREREPERFLEAGKETPGLAQWHPEHRAKA